MTENTEEKPLYLGHRARLRERFMADEGASMPDYELLELILTMAIPRKDVKPLAKKLIIKLGNIGSVINAPVKELRDNYDVPPQAIVLLKAVATCILRSTSSSFEDYSENIITSWEQFWDYCRQLMGYKEIEEFRVFFFDDNLRYKGNRLLSTGTINKTSVHPREILRTAIDNKATFIILAHNHPSGNLKPSPADIKLTENICEFCRMMELDVFDHLIVTKTDIFSFKNAGLIIPPKKDDNI